MGNRLMGSGKAGEINRAAGEMPPRKGDGAKSSKPAASRGGSEVGEEKHYSSKAWSGNPTDSSSLKGAVGELRSQHPYKHDDHGPHHGKKHHDRHEPMHGMHSKAKHGR